MSSSIKLTNSSGKIVTITNPDTTSADVAVDLLNNAYTIATVDDFGTVPVGYTTVIVKDTDRGGIFVWSASGTANGGTVFAGSSGYWVRQYDGAINVKWFGANGDGITDDTTAIQNAIDYALTNKNALFFPSGHYKFNTLEFNASSYDVGFYDERGTLLFGDGRNSTRLDGHLIFSAINGGGPYSARFSGMFIRDLNIYNSNGNGLTFSGFGKCYIENCHIRGDNGVGLSLLGGSEFSAYNCEIYGSNTNLKIRHTSLNGDSIDCAVLSFYECNIANTVGGSTPLNIDYVGNGRSINFFGGNIISSSSQSYFENGYIYFSNVDFENTNPVKIKNGNVHAINCLFAVPTYPKIKLENSLFIDDGNLWDASVPQCIFIEDTLSKVVLNKGYSNPTIWINHTNNISQIQYPGKSERFLNDDFSKQTYEPYDLPAPITFDTTNYVTGNTSVYSATAGNYLVIPIKRRFYIREIDAIEFIANTESALQFVYNGVLVNASSLGILFKLQNVVSTGTTNFSKYLWIPSHTSGLISEIRISLNGTTYKVDSIEIFGNVVKDDYRRTAAPTTGTWSVGNIVYNKTPAASGNIGWVCTIAGTPGTWKSFGTISA